MRPEDNPLNLKDRAPEQGEQFTEPKVGGLYPVAGAVAAGACLIVAVAVLF